MIRRQITTALVTLLITLLAISSVVADEIITKNGSRLIGELISAESDKIIFNTSFAGRITLSTNNVQRITTQQPVTFMLKNGAFYRDRQIISTEKALLVGSENGAYVIFDAADIKMINPEPWKLGEGYNWYGGISLALEFERGNSETDEWNLKTNSVWRSLEDRYTLKGDMEYEESRNIKKEDNWHLTSKYDRFLKSGSRDYRGMSLSFEHDEFADIDLRTIIGVYTGRQFSENDHFTLQMEFGPVWVDERFNEANSDNWLGAKWDIKASSDIVGFGTKTYINHDGILNTGDPRDTILNTTIGIKVPIFRGFETAFEAEYEYDGGAVEDVEQLDATYNLRFGYSW